MLLCGLRSQEALDLRLGDLDFDDHRICVHGKGNKERAVPLPGLLVGPKFKWPGGPHRSSFRHPL
jgi:integrase